MNKIYIPLIFLCAFVLMGITCNSVGTVAGSSSAPLITSISPNQGPVTGGTTVTISGANFVPGSTTVTIGGNNAPVTNVVLESFTGLTTLTCTSPTSTATGAVDVVVRISPTVSTTWAGGFTYPNPPSLSSLDRIVGSSEGGTLITITGRYFATGSTSVTFGGQNSSNVKVLSGIQLTCNAPIGTVGPAVDVTVTTPWGAATKTGGYTFYAPPTITSPTIGFTTKARVQDELSFNITATSSTGVNVTLTLLNPPPGCVFIPQTQQASPTTMAVNWRVRKEGIQNLFFSAYDSDYPYIKKMVTVSIHILGNYRASGILAGDVTGDGILDTIALSQSADISPKINTGAIYIFAGSTSPSTTPTATLTVQSANSGDSLGQAGKAQGLFLADVNGDGNLDIIALAPKAKIAQASQAGAIYIWYGGQSFSGTVYPSRILTATTPNQGDQLGYIGDSFATGRAVCIEDVTGDGVNDIIVGASKADVTGINSAGAIYIWKGGATTSTPLATLTINTPVMSDQLAWEQGILIRDVNGDSNPDIISLATGANLDSKIDVGAAYVWMANTAVTDRFSGTQTPTATLALPNTQSVAKNKLGFVGNAKAVSPGILIANITGDNSPDIIIGASKATVQINKSSGLTTVGGGGAVYVWTGGSSLGTGRISPDFTLTIPNSEVDDNLGSTGDIYTLGPGIQVGDVTGDGTEDLVVAASLADPHILKNGVNGLPPAVSNAGAIYVWTGGSLGATPKILHTYDSTPANDWGAVKDDKLCYQQGFLLFDLTGDGKKEIIGGTIYGDVKGVTSLGKTTTAIQDAGAVYIWQGNNLTQTPSRLAVFNPAVARLPVANDHLGFVGNGTTPTAPGIFIRDIAGDSNPEIIVFASQANITITRKSLATKTIVDAGAIYVWAGASGAIPSGSPAILLAYNKAEDNETGNNTDLIPWQNDFLGYTTGYSGIEFADVTGDNILDIIVGASLANPVLDKGRLTRVTDAGAIYIWQGGLSLNTAKMVTLTAYNGTTGSLSNDKLMTQGYSFHIGDIDGDRILDITALTSNTTLGGKTKVGAFYFWKGGSSIVSAPRGTFYVKTANSLSGDQLGGGTNGLGFSFSDLNGDGITDFIIGTPHADVVLQSGTRTDTGAIYLWNGVLGMAGNPLNPNTTLRVSGAVTGDKLGF